MPCMPPNKSRRDFHSKKKFSPQARSHTRRLPPSTHPLPSSQSGPQVYVEGILQVKGKVGFILSEDSKLGDVLIQGPSLKLAMEGDRVRAHVLSTGADGRRMGVITAVLVRARDTVVGTFKRFGNMAAVSLDADAIVRILDMGKLSPKVGDVIVVRITRWPTSKEAPAGVLTEILGSRNTPGVDLDEVIRRYDLPQKFTEEVQSEAAAFGSEVPESMWKDPSRELFFDRRLFTIDGADAKDFDDAVSLEPITDGWRLGVHIADVAQYVKPESSLDKEAYRRGTSVYFPGSVLPMLPFPLSDGLCSLRPDCVRLTLSCLMDIDQEGRVKNYRIVESAIKSSKRFTYEEVEEILKGTNPPNLDPLVIKDVRDMGTLARLLRKKRLERGSLDFDFPEPNVVLDPHGRPIDIHRKDRLEAHRLIEDFMLLANETVARHMQGRPFLYRIHETPDPTRVEKLFKTLDAIGLVVPKNRDTTHPSAFRAILAAAEGKPIQQMVHMSILRSLKQAIYSPVDKGHYGLASESYTHFTSPIRRYPDLIVHRLLKERIHNVQRAEYWSQKLSSICEHTSKRERVAVEAEREFMDVQKVRLMEPHVGETFSGVISGVTNFGFFVELDTYFIQGLVHVTNLGSDYYVFDENRQTLSGRRNGHTFAMGQKVKVQLASANVLKRQIDFQLVSESPRPRQQDSKPQKHFHRHKRR